MEKVKGKILIIALALMLLPAMAQAEAATSFNDMVEGKDYAAGTHTVYMKAVDKNCAESAPMSAKFVK